MLVLIMINCSARQQGLSTVNNVFLLVHLISTTLVLFQLSVRVFTPLSVCLLIRVERRSGTGDEE